MEHYAADRGMGARFRHHPGCHPGLGRQRRLQGPHPAEQRNLITRQRHGRKRKIRVTLLREDASGQPYTRPGKGNPDRFLRLPHAFWREGWHERLDLPASAMLLVALHEKANFELPAERVPDWYGWSADTAERGLATLEHFGLLTRTTRLKKAPLSPSGLTKVNRYLLHEPFGQLSADDIFNDDVIGALVYPLPRKNRPGPGHGGRDRKGGPIMTASFPGPGSPAPQAPRPDRRALHWPEPSTPRGAVLYAVIAGLIVWIVVTVLSHLHVVISWH